MASSSSHPGNLWVLLGLGLAGILLAMRRFKKAVREDFGAFIHELQLLPPPPPAPPKAPHPLTGLAFAVSDLFDIEGHVTGFGHPDWARTHEAASRTSSVVSSLLEGGATCIGKTVVDELAYGINGENKHYGTPTNPAAPARVPGGSSSGAAVAVASDLVDFSLGELLVWFLTVLEVKLIVNVLIPCFLGCSHKFIELEHPGLLCYSPGSLDYKAFIHQSSLLTKSFTTVLILCLLFYVSCAKLSAEYANTRRICSSKKSNIGVDTVGGVRVPAGYCGILGFRPSYGAIPQMGIIPISASLDTVGWLAKDPSILRRVGHLLLQPPFGVQRNPRQIIIADDCFQLIKIPVERLSQVVIKSTEKVFGRQVLKHEILEKLLHLKVPSLKEFHDKANGEIKTSSIRLLAIIMQVLHRYEFKSNHGEWINTEKPILDPVISAQINEVNISETEIEVCRSIRNEMRTAINSLLKDDGILVIPTAAYLPPKLGGKEMLSEDYQIRSFSLLSIANLSGCCQATIPLGQYDKCPVSVSLIARHGGDHFLLDAVQSIYASFQEEAEMLGKSKILCNTVSREISAELAKEKGNQSFKDKQWQKAIGFYTEAIKLNGKNATYYSNRAAAYLEVGSFLQAEADCTMAINLDKKNVKAYFRRGTAREMLGYYKEAIDDFNYAHVLEPTNKRAASSAERLRKVFH